MENEEKVIEPRVRAYTLKDLAKIYDTSPWIMRGWIKKIGPQLGKRIGHYYNPRQVQMIFDHCGKPFLVLFAFFVQSCEALEKKLNSADLNADGNGDDSINNHQHGSETSSDPAATVPYFGISMFLMFVIGNSLKNLIRSVTGDNYRRSFIKQFKSSDPSNRKFHPLVNIAFQATVFCVATIALGYAVGKIIF